MRLALADPQPARGDVWLVHYYTGNIPVYMQLLGTASMGCWWATQMHRDGTAWSYANDGPEQIDPRRLLRLVARGSIKDAPPIPQPIGSMDCIHFNGVQHGRCKAGVRYEMVRVDRPGKPRGLPCLLRQVGGGERPDTCNCYEPVSALLAEQKWQETEEIVEAVLAGACPQCFIPCDRDEGERTTLLTCKEHGLVARECKRIGEPYDEFY